VKPTPAPIDRRALEPALRPFGESRLLPAEAYTSPEVFAWEVKHFFEGSWVCVGNEEGLGDPGDQKAVRVGNDSVVLVRGEDGVLRGFYNSCRHRAHELLQVGECRRARSLRCPYHAWQYALDGSLQKSVLASHAESFDPGPEGLVPACVATWRGFVFVNASGDAPPLSEWLGDLEDIARPYETEKLVVMARHEYELPANWKLVVENYHECYHCPQIHPELCRVSPPDSGVSRDGGGAWVGGWQEFAGDGVTMSLDGTSLGTPLPGVKGDILGQVYYVGLLPNMLLSYHPDYVMVHRMEPRAVNRTWIECAWLFPPEAAQKPGFSPRYAEEFWDITNRQDWKAVESVQRGVESRGYVPGTLTPREDCLYHFVSRIARGYRDGVLRPQPEPAEV
jgi:Rieske 2Fe-2S family protein